MTRAELPAYDSRDEISRYPWIHVRAVACARLRWLGPLYHARVQHGDGLFEHGAELPALVVPACTCPDVAGLTRRAAGRRAIRRHNRRTRAGTCPGRFLFTAPKGP